MDTNNAVLSAMEVDAIGEVLNISMGAAATAVSSMLDKMVTITTPKVDVEKLADIDCGALEPAIIVTITYTDGLDGSNVMVFRQKDMQVILNQLMGIDEEPSDTFVFDELSMSAACEVMNQMMGSASTALAEFLGQPVNISTPQANIMDETHTFKDSIGLPEDSNIISVLFNMDIQGVMNTEFISILPVNLAKMIVSKFMPDGDSGAVVDPAQSAPPTQPVQPSPPPAPPMQPVQPSPPPMPPMQPPVQPSPSPVPPMQPVQPTPPPMPPMQQPPITEPPRMVQPVTQPQDMQQQGYPPYQQPTGYPPQAGAYGQYPPPMGYQQGYPQPPYPMQGYAQPGYPPPYGYPPQGMSPMQQAPSEPVNVQNVQFPEFGRAQPSGEPIMGKNVELLMNVPLDVAIEIGQTKKKIKDIMSFTQGTVIELEKQAGAPIDIVVNGQLIAHGDVVVIDDNFGVRITEIVGTKELLNSLEKEMQ
ncbi:MAG: flagellar motor switch protein FliN [Oscillospiraceae bacterium]